MNEILVAALLFGSFAVMLVLDFPISLSLGLSSLLTIVVFSLSPLEFFPQMIFASTDSFTLLAIPFFIFAGIVLGNTSISKRLMDFADSLVGNIPGGIGIVGVIAAVFFAGISGSGPADVAALGLILIPAMTVAGYGKNFSSALTAAAGGIGIIVPPSIALVIYGSVAEVSIPKLFIAGIIPGFIIAFSLMIVVFFHAKRKNIRPGMEYRERKGVWSSFKDALWGILAPVIILGGIYGGIFTPTESAAVAVLYGLAVDLFIYRSIGIKKIIKIAGEAAVTSSSIMSIVICASLFAWILNTQGIASKIGIYMISITDNVWMVLLIINIILLVAGLFLDAISIFYIFLPILTPVLKTSGIDPLHFGIIMTVNLAIGQVTPPVGINLAAASSISGEKVSAISKSVVPFIIAEIFALIIITYFPFLTLFLPGLMK
jgi:C4-dicarboxylate transporter, DctM subunit